MIIFCQNESECMSDTQKRGKKPNFLVKVLLPWQAEMRCYGVIERCQGEYTTSCVNLRRFRQSMIVKYQKYALFLKKSFCSKMVNFGKNASLVTNGNRALKTAI